MFPRPNKHFHRDFIVNLKNGCYLLTAIITILSTPLYGQDKSIFIYTKFYAHTRKTLNPNNICLHNLYTVMKLTYLQIYAAEIYLFAPLTVTTWHYRTYLVLLELFSTNTNPGLTSSSIRTLYVFSKATFQTFLHF